MKTKRILSLLLLIICTMSCSQGQKSKDFDYGKIEDNVYSNAFFNFKIDIPTTWSIQNKEQINNLIEKGKKIVAGDNENLKKVLEASEINSAYLLTIFKHELGSPVDYNPSLMIIAENLKLSPGIKTGGDYLFHTRKILQQTTINYHTIDDDFKQVDLNNQEFYQMNAHATLGGIALTQRYYSTIKNGFSINVVISFANDEQRAELEEILKSLAFSK